MEVDVDAQTPSPSREQRLRERLLEIARRRVPEAAVEEIVGGALAAVEVSENEPALRRALAALRSSICTYYESLETQELSGLVAGDAPLVTESLSETELATACQRALRQLEEDSPAAAGYLRQLAAGASAEQVAQRVKISREILYQRLFRGREQLDRILVALGVRT